MVISNETGVWGGETELAMALVISHALRIELGSISTVWAAGSQEGPQKALELILSFRGSSPDPSLALQTLLILQPKKEIVNGEHTENGHCFPAAFM